MQDTVARDDPTWPLVFWFERLQRMFRSDVRGSGAGVGTRMWRPAIAGQLRGWVLVQQFGGGALDVPPRREAMRQPLIQESK